MKKYILDQIGVLAIAVGLACIFPRMCRYHFWPTFVLEVMLLPSSGYLCRRILVLPLDIVIGKRMKVVYFSRVCNVENYEFFPKRYHCEWRFYSSEGTLKVLVPVALSKEEIQSMHRPKADQKVKVCYYPYSKILCSWEIM